MNVQNAQCAWVCIAVTIRCNNMRVRMHKFLILIHPINTIIIRITIHLEIHRIVHIFMPCHAMICHDVICMHDTTKKQTNRRSKRKKKTFERRMNTHSHTAQNKYRLSLIIGWVSTWILRVIAAYISFKYRMHTNNHINLHILICFFLLFFNLMYIIKWFWCVLIIAQPIFAK